MLRNIKARLAALGKTQVWLCKELRRRGYPQLHTPRLSAIINGSDNCPSSADILNLADSILNEIERND